ncbi:HD domain-containing protein [Fodinicola acaciae]|uniref:HD domain-containing protein n=1 Tax=Fodinicola acaciae TaxID=2681555 RepID=UPI0013D0D958|nr:HD domain-containing protein [Fodinicola acaciae]
MDNVSPAYLMTLPLHAVTEVYGTEGLRRRFLLEAEVLDDQDRVVRALTLAERLHQDDKRVREPYVNHVLRVAIRILRHYGVRDADVVIAGLLHDTVEDHPAELAGGAPADPRQAAFGVLERDFGRRVAEIVGAVTNPVYDPERDSDEQYREHVAASLAAYPWARVVKASDFTDNGVGIIHTSGPKIRRAATKYQPLTPVLHELVQRDDTPLTDAAKRHIVDQLQLADERFSAILSGS